MPLYKALYGRKCRTPLCLLEAGENRLTRPVRITNEKINVVQTHIKAAQDCQRSYMNLKERPFEMNFGLIGNVTNITMERGDAFR